MFEPKQPNLYNYRSPAFLLTPGFAALQALST
jgi:hypothetical protein